MQLSLVVDDESELAVSRSDLDGERDCHGISEAVDEDLSASDHVRVVVRCRPLKPPREQDGSAEVSLQSDEKTICVQSRGSNRKYQFVCVANPRKGQEYMFQKTGRHVVDCALAGFNGAIVAYGQTGSGKTYTMQGPGLGKKDQMNDSSKGIIQRVCETIFAHKEEQEAIDSSVTFKITAEYLEIYNETVKDLLFEGNGKRSKTQPKIGIFEDAKGTIIVQNQTTRDVSSPEECYQLLREGGTRRTVGATNMNSESSRSHAIFTLQIDKNDQTKGVKRKSKLHLVDLAGSERQRGTGATGIRLKEAGGINKSLSALGNVINALAEREGARRRGERPGRIPSYRDSKLTFLLKDSFGGNSKLCLIATISPAAGFVEETANTLEFAKRCCSVRNEAVVNEHLSEDVARLQAEIRRLQQTIKQLKSSLAKAKNTEIELRAAVTKVQTAPVHVKSGGACKSEVGESKGPREDKGGEKEQVEGLDKALRTVDTEELVKAIESLTSGESVKEGKESCIEKLCLLLVASATRESRFRKREKELEEQAEYNRERWLEAQRQSERSLPEKGGSFADNKGAGSETRILRQRITALEEELSKANGVARDGEEGERKHRRQNDENWEQKWLETVKTNEELLIHLKEANRELFQVRQKGAAKVYGQNGERLRSLLESSKGSDSTEVKILQERVRGLEKELVEFAEISLAAHKEEQEMRDESKRGGHSGISVDLSSDLEECEEELFDRSGSGSESEKENKRGNETGSRKKRVRNRGETRGRGAEALLQEIAAEIKTEQVETLDETELEYTRRESSRKPRKVLHGLQQSVAHLQTVLEQELDQER